MTQPEEKKYWNNLAKDHSLQSNHIIAGTVTIDDCLKAIVPELKIIEQTTILEIGSGIGRMTIPIAAEFPDAKVIGLDIAKKLIKLAPKHERVAYVEGDGRTLPFEHGTLSGIYTMAVFQHIPNDAKEAYIKEAARVLIQGGVFRVQFVEDAESGPLSYGISRDEIMLMCEYAGMAVDKVETELIEPNWVWVTAVNQ